MPLKKLDEVLAALPAVDDMLDQTDAAMLAPVLCQPTIHHGKKRKQSDSNSALQLFQKVFRNFVDSKDKMDACQAWLSKEKLDEKQLQTAICVVCENIDNFYNMNDQFKKAFLLGRGVQFPVDTDTVIDLD